MRSILAPLLALTLLPAQAAVHDLSADWSFTHNPNGVWTYMRGGSPFSTTVDNWSGFGPAWADSANGGPGFVPMLMRYDGVSAQGEFDALHRDVVGHSQDPGGNEGAGELVVRFTAPSPGSALISGSLWDAQINEDRDQVWQVLVDGVVKASGVVLGDGSEGRDNADLFSLNSIGLLAGSEVDLRITRSDGNAGGLVGMSLTVNVTPVPEPGTWAMAATGLLALGAWRRRQATRAR